jgi:cytochrome c2
MVGAVLVLAGCGTGGIVRDSSTTGGKELFVSECGSCHVLADAGTTGKVGPDLDAAFGPSRQQGFKESTIRQIVRDQIHLPSPAADSPGFPVMPADLVKGEDADTVAAYVASVAGTGATPPTTIGGTTTTPTTPTSPTATGGGTTTAPSPSGGDAANGKSLFASLGCGSCHSIDGSEGLGPTVKGLFGIEVELADGKTVTADDSYLIEAIEDPDAQIVKGYQPGIMSATIKPHQVAEADARDLVAYIKTLK